MSLVVSLILSNFSLSIDDILQKLIRKAMHVYSEMTHHIHIEVQPTFVSNQSRPEMSYYFFAYTVKISNQSEEIVQLLSRHWLITNGNGEVEEVNGEGVIGKQPLIEPGQFFSYTSFCPLPTPTGNMRGKYRMRTQTGREFDAKIPLFFLRELSSLH